MALTATVYLEKNTGPNAVAPSQSTPAPELPGLADLPFRHSFHSLPSAYVDLEQWMRPGALLPCLAQNCQSLKRETLPCYILHENLIGAQVSVIMLVLFWFCLFVWVCLVSSTQDLTA